MIRMGTRTADFVEAVAIHSLFERVKNTNESQEDCENELDHASRILNAFLHPNVTYTMSDIHDPENAPDRKMAMEAFQEAVWDSTENCEYCCPWCGRTLPADTLFHLVRFARYETSAVPSCYYCEEDLYDANLKKKKA